MKRLLVTLVAIGLMAGCASMKINTDWSRQTDFSKFKTYAYKETPDLSVADTNQLTHERIISGIKREMNAKGLKEVESNPDVYVTYYGEEKDQVALDTTSFGYGYGPGWYWGGGWGGGMGTSTTTVRQYQTGTLVVDMWDAKAKELVWRGVISDTISDDPQKNAQKINKGLASIFKRYPPDNSAS